MGLKYPAAGHSAAHIPLTLHVTDHINQTFLSGKSEGGSFPRSSRSVPVRPGTGYQNLPENGKRLPESESVKHLPEFAGIRERAFSKIPESGNGL